MNHQPVSAANSSIRVVMVSLSGMSLPEVGKEMAAEGFRPLLPSEFRVHSHSLQMDFDQRIVMPLTPETEPVDLLHLNIVVVKLPVQREGEHSNIRLADEVRQGVSLFVAATPSHN